MELTAAAAVPDLAKPISSEPKMVHAAESATANFANNDVSRAVLRAQEQAKKQYQSMMASALKVYLVAVLCRITRSVYTRIDASLD